MTHAKPPALAVAFPGQGIPARDVAAALARFTEAPLARSLARLLGDDNWSALDMNDTRVSQPAVYAASLLIARSVIKPRGVAAVAGHSLGEIAALAFAECVSDEEGLEIAWRRGVLCHQVVSSSPGAMVAIMGLDAAQIEWVRRTAIGECGGRPLDIASANSERQFVLSGEPEPIRAAIAIATANGGVASMLPIGGAFHSPILASACGSLRSIMADVALQPPSCRFISTIMAAEVSVPNDIREALVRALVMPVRWADSVAALVRLGVSAVYEPGPGKTLTKLGKRLRLVPFLEEEDLMSLPDDYGPS